MLLISHRGNLDGKSDGLENNPAYIDFALHQGFDVEIDVWRYKNDFWLGHDEPTHKVSSDWLEDRRDELWCHAKNIEAMKDLVSLNLHSFGHDKDAFVVTSHGFVIVHPDARLIKGCIAMLPEQSKNVDLSGCLGICSDNIGAYA
jgi:hypothetical protein